MASWQGQYSTQLQQEVVLLQADKVKLFNNYQDLKNDHDLLIQQLPDRDKSI